MIRCDPDYVWGTNIRRNRENFIPGDLENLRMQARRLYGTKGLWDAT